MSDAYKPTIIHEDTAILDFLKMSGVVSEEKIKKARKFIRGLSDYSKSKRGIVPRLKRDAKKKAAK